MAQVVKDNIWACEDCSIAVVNDDLDHIDDVLAYEKSHNGRLVMCDDEDSYNEFSMDSCDVCETYLHGRRHKLALLRD